MEDGPDFTDRHFEQPHHNDGRGGGMGTGMGGGQQPRPGGFGASEQQPPNPQTEPRHHYYDARDPNGGRRQMPQQQAQAPQPSSRDAMGMFLRGNLHIILIVAIIAYMVYRKGTNMYYTRNPRRSMDTVAKFQEEMAAARLRQMETAKVVRELKAEMKAKADEAAGTPSPMGVSLSSMEEGRSAPTQQPVVSQQPQQQSPAAAAFLARRQGLLQEYPNSTAAGVLGGHRLGARQQTSTGTASSSAAIAVPTFPPTILPASAATAASATCSATATANTTVPRPKPSAKASSSYRFADDSDDDDPRGPRKKLPKLKGGDRAEWEANNRGGDDRKNYFKRDCGPKGG